MRVVVLGVLELSFGPKNTALSWVGGGVRALAQVEAMFARVDDELGTLTALVNNAVRPAPCPAKTSTEKLGCSREGQSVRGYVHVDTPWHERWLLSALREAQ